uniref:ATP synthase complex subunit 8 n=1 Tax=Batrachoseps wrighti TaxID=57547 RepID=Q644U1_BATWR|nr:ATP synthase F0 subunit 8 [Batrachoseps wrighti]AAU20543.1 ATP synthase F0 subunit 8 [Batrachoseps wrighti]ABX46738.1 ATPase subunit 8 [Batrachoseps wrighti]
MPQLNPNPWLLFFIVSWLVYLTILTPKMNNLKMLNEPTMKNINMNMTQHWNWPWT